MRICYNNSCSSGSIHNLTVYVENTGIPQVAIDTIYVENVTGSLYTLSLNETRILSTGDMLYLTNLSSAECSGINNSIESVIIISTNCPENAHDKFPGADVAYVNC